jgi:hypothetical protein
MAIQDGTYRIYNVQSNGAGTLTYTLAARFKIQNGVIAPIEDPQRWLKRYVGIGPLTPESTRFLESFMRGSYRHTIIEIPGREYLAQYTEQI